MRLTAGKWRRQADLLEKEVIRLRKAADEMDRDADEAEEYNRIASEPAR